MFFSNPEAILLDPYRRCRIDYSFKAIHYHTSHTSLVKKSVAKLKKKTFTLTLILIENV